jgi:hypothetical protein
LIVAVVNFIRQLINVARQVNIDNGGNVIVLLVFCRLDCLLWLINWLVTYFNNNRVHHGKAYLPAAKDTWTIVRHKVIDALVIDSPIGGVVSVGSTFIGLLCAVLGYLYLRLTELQYNSGGGNYPIVVAFSFLIGTQIGKITTVSISFGIHTLFVALAKDADVFRLSCTDTYVEILRTPEVQNRLNLP